MSDSSLLDPALEASNYSAPGADRLRLTPELGVVDFDDPIGPPDFVTLFTIKDGIFQVNYERPQYNILADEMAKRTYDEFGDYYVRGLGVSIREHLDNGSNGGRYTAGNGGNTAQLSIEVSPGLAYVKGYELGTLDTTYLMTDKALTYTNVNNQITAAGMGSFIFVSMSSLETGMTDSAQAIYLYDTAHGPHLYTEILDWRPDRQPDRNANLKSIGYNSGTLGTANGEVDVYLMDIRMLGSNNFSNVRSVYFNNSRQRGPWW